MKIYGVSLLRILGVWTVGWFCFACSDDAGSDTEGNENGNDSDTGTGEYRCDSSLLLTADTILVIDGENNCVVDSVVVGEMPVDIAVNAETDMIYVGVMEMNKVVVVDGSSHEVTDEIDVPGEPSTLSVNPETGLVYAVTAANGTVTVIDGDTNSVVQEIAAGSGFPGIAVDDSSNLIYEVDVNNLYIIDGEDNELSDIVPIDGYEEGDCRVDVNPTNQKIYIGNEQSNEIQIWDGASLEILNTLAISFEGEDYGTEGEICVNSVTGNVYIAREDSALITVIDGESDDILENFLRGENDKGGRAVGVNEATNRIYVTDEIDDLVMVFEGETNELLTTVTVGGRPSSLDVNPETNLIFVGGD